VKRLSPGLSTIVDLATIVRERLGIELAELAGTTVSGEIPLSNAVVNRVIAERLAGRQLPVSSVHVEAREGDVIVAHVTPRARFVPPIRIDTRIETQPDFPGHPVLWLRWSIPGAGLLALVAAPALAFFKALPPGIRVDGDRIAVDVRELLHARGHGEILPLVRGVRVHTRESVIAVQFDLHVPAAR
jgi:hypothetical protein